LRVEYYGMDMPNRGLAFLYVFFYKKALIKERIFFVLISHCFFSGFIVLNSTLLLASQEHSISNLNIALITDQNKTVSKALVQSPEPDLQILQLTEKERKWLDKHKTIRFTGDPNWLPYEAFDD